MNLNMLTTQNKVLLVVATGPLIGITTAVVFASKGFTHIALIARSTSNLKKLAESIPKSAITKTYPADVSKPDNLTAMLEQVKTDFGAPEVVLYNGSVISSGTLGAQTEEDIMNELMVCVPSIQERFSVDSLFKGFNSRSIYDGKVGDTPSSKCVPNI
jgi:NAD(P)-dependent dehydrogenase (short-subunit alcohol dehydrogenase family)